MPMSPKDLIFTEEAVVLLDLTKTLTWKTTYETVAERVRDDGRGMVTLEDVLSTLEPAMKYALDEATRSAEALIADRDAV
jgi:hypothetical protein